MIEGWLHSEKRSLSGASGAVAKLGWGLGGWEREVKAIMMLVEGLVEEIVYSSLLEKLCGGAHVGCEEISRELRELIEPFKGMLSAAHWSRYLCANG